MVGGPSGLAPPAGPTVEALPLLHAGETAVLWLPPRPGTLEPVAYKVELVEVLASRPAAASDRPASG